MTTSVGRLGHSAHRCRVKCRKIRSVPNLVEMLMTRYWGSLLLTICLSTPLLSPGAQVDVFSPQGEVKGVRQIAARFSDHMVALGDPRLDAPFEIDCPP